MSNLGLVFVCTYGWLIFASFAYGAHWAFYLYELVYFLNPEKRWWSAAIPFANFSFFAVVTLFLSYFFKAKKLHYQDNRLKALPHFKWLILLLLSYGLVYFSAADKNVHSDAFIEYLKLFIVIGLAYKVIDTKKKFEYAIYTLIIGIAYLGYEVHSLGRDEFGRVGRFGMIDAPDVNVATAAMISALPFLILYFWRGSKQKKFVMVVLGAIIANALVLANSRGAFVGGFIGSAYFVYEMFRSRFKQKFQRATTVLLIVLGLLSVYTVVDETFMERMFTLTEVEDQSRSGSGRVQYWMISFDVLEDYPFGVGAYGYEILSPQYVPRELFDQGKSTKAVHSVWFQALTELGYIGFIFYMMVIYLSYRSFKLVKKKCAERKDIDGYYLTHATLASFIGVLAASSFINQFRTQIIYWFILFSACLLNIYILKDKENKTMDKPTDT